MTAAWIRPKACSGGACPEVKAANGRVRIRDSRRPAEEVWFTPEGWAALVAAVKAGEYDDTAGAL